MIVFALYLQSALQIFEVLHHFISIFLPGYTQFMVKAGWVQSDRDDPMIFSGFEISILGFLFGRKIWASFVWASFIY